MPSIIEKADRITSGPLDPAPEFLNGALHGLFIRVGVFDHIKAKLAQCASDELGIADGVFQPLKPFVGVIPDHQRQAFLRRRLQGAYDKGHRQRR